MSAPARLHRRARLAHPFRPALLLAALALAGIAPSVNAIDVYWDPNLGNPGIGGSGFWDDVQANWSTSPSGIVFLFPPLGIHNGASWPDGALSVATFGGTGGTVNMTGTQTAGGLRFLSDGYVLQGGNLRLVSDFTAAAVEVAEGATSRLSSPLEVVSLTGHPSLTFTGGGTLILSPPVSLDVEVDVRNGTLQAGTSGALASTFVKVTGANARFDATPLRTVALAGLDTLQTPLELGSSAISLTGSGSVGTTSHFEAGVNGNRSSGVVVGTLAETALVIGGASGAAPASSFGYLRVSQGNTSIVGTTVSLTAALSTTPEELGALQLDSGGTLDLSAGARLTVTSTASLVGGADLSVSGGSVLSVIRDATRHDLPATLAVGTGGGPAGVRVSGTQSRASSADRIVLGRTAARDAGTGVLVAGSGGTIESPVLSFATASSRFLLNPGGTGRFNRLDDGGTGLGTVEMAGGTLIVGDTSFASPLGTSDSSFGGTLTGAAGTVRKVGAGEFFLSGVTNYLGTVQVDSGTLRVNPGTLANAVLTMLPGARLTVSGASPANPLRIGALEGEFDLEQQNLTLEFGAGLHEARWSGRFTSGTVGLSRTSGPGVQRFTGGTEASPFTAPFLSVSTGAVRLGGGFFSFTDTASTPVATAPLDVSGANAVLGIVDGAQVRAGSGVRVHGGGLLFVTGTGSRLDVQPDSATGRSSLSVGQDGLGSLAMSAGGSVTASDLRLGTSRGPTGAEVSVAGGGQLFLDLLSFEGYGGTLIVSGGTAFIHRLDSVVHDPLRPSVIELSDGPSGTPALTLGTPGAAPGTSTRFRGSISDGALGPGSIRKIGSDEIIANPHISGRLIIDEGVFRVEDRTALEGATVEINRDDGLVYSSTLGGMVLMGALSGSGRFSLPQTGLNLGSTLLRDATFAGALNLGAMLLKNGENKQVLTGGARFTSVSVEGGTLEFRGGEYELLPGNGVIWIENQLGDARLTLSGGARFDDSMGSTHVLSKPDRNAFLLLSGPDTRLITQDVRVQSQGSASVRVENGAKLVAIQGMTVGGRDVSFAVDRGSVETGPVFLVDPQQIFSISDPVATVGQTSLTRPAAWTVTTAPGRPGYTPDFVYRGHFEDGPSGPGSVAFAGSGFRAVFSGQLNYTGRTIVDGSGVALEIRGPIASREFIALNGGTLDLTAPLSGTLWDVSSRSFRTDDSGVIRYDGLQLIGGTLRGIGHEVASQAASFDGTSLAANSRFTARRGVAWSNASLSGMLDARAGLTLDNVMITSGGSLVLGSGATFADVENNGVLDLRTGAGLELTSPMVSGGGSQVLVSQGAALEGAALTMRGALLVNNGTVSAPLTLDFGSLAMGGGTFGSVTVNRGGTFAPGNSPGTASTLGPVVFNAGGEYEVEVADALGAPGTGFDLWDIAGTLDINAGTTFNSQFVVSLISMDAAFAAGPAANFDKHRSFAWTVLRADAIDGFDPKELRLDTSAFENDTDGKFSLQLEHAGGRSELQIVYQPVPEPATTGLMLGGLVTLLAWRRRRA